MTFGLSNRGIALPLVLWTITILMTLVLSFALASRTEMRMASHFRMSREKRFFAEAGVERALLEITYGASAAGKADTDHPPWRADDSPYSEKLGKGVYTVSLVDESGKISINGLNDANSMVLRNLVIRLGASSETADTIVDSILDWKDADDLRRLNGAEDEYYLALPVPYKARNGEFQAPEELLLVKGVTEEIFFGTGTKKGLSSYVTVYSTHGGVNLQAASREVLLSLPGMTDSLVDSLISYRESTPAWNAAEVQTLLGPAFAQMSAYASAATQKIYTVTSRGYVEGEKTAYPLVATVKIGDSGPRYLYYKCPSEGGE